MLNRSHSRPGNLPSRSPTGQGGELHQTASSPKQLLTRSQARLTKAAFLLRPDCHGPGEAFVHRVARTSARRSAKCLRALRRAGLRVDKSGPQTGGIDLASEPAVSSV
jgi:hypothetical protein